MASPEGIADAMLAIERTNAGYSQGSNPDTGRWSFLINKDARPPVLRQGRAADCSSAVAAAVVMAGYPLSLKTVNGVDIFTGNQRAKFAAVGAQDLPFTRSNVRRGDVLWRAGHTEIATSPTQQTGARIDENGNIVGGSPGDQGHEFATSPLTNGWTRILRFPTTGTTDSQSQQADTAGGGNTMFMLGLKNGRGTGKTIYAVSGPGYWLETDNLAYATNINRQLTGNKASPSLALEGSAGLAFWKAAQAASKAGVK